MLFNTACTLLDLSDVMLSFHHVLAALVMPKCLPLTINLTVMTMKMLYPSSLSWLIVSSMTSALPQPLHFRVFYTVDIGDKV